MCLTICHFSAHQCLGELNSSQARQATNKASHAHRKPFTYRHASRNKKPLSKKLIGSLLQVFICSTSTCKPACETGCNQAKMLFDELLQV